MTRRVSRVAWAVGAPEASVEKFEPHCELAFSEVVLWFVSCQDIRPRVCWWCLSAVFHEPVYPVDLFALCDVVPVADGFDSPWSS